MIRRSTAIAVTAMLLSVMVHFLGLGFVPPNRPDQPATGNTADDVTLGNAFEDIAEAQPEPVQPEPAEVPDPPVETPPEPETADTPTSEALVASSNPQRTFAPDTGSAKIVHPETTGPAEPDDGIAVAPETVKPSGGDDGKSVDPGVTPPVEPDTVAETPKGDPDAQTPPAEAELTASLAPAPSVTPSPAPATVSVVPPEIQPVEPETLEPTPETTDEDADRSELAVVASPRPRLPTTRPSADPQGTPDGSPDYSDLQFPPMIESPLTAYLRGQGNLQIRQSGGTQSGGIGFQNSRGPGNSDVTNYAGQVLVHLNRSPPVHVSGRGFARVFFEISPDGSLAWVDIIDGSGSPEIDRAAKAQVRIAAPFPRPPQGASRKLVFVYRIN